MARLVTLLATQITHRVDRFDAGMILAERSHTFTRQYGGRVVNPRGHAGLMVTFSEEKVAVRFQRASRTAGCAGGGRCVLASGAHCRADRAASKRSRLRAG